MTERAWKYLKLKEKEVICQELKHIQPKKMIWNYIILWTTNFSPRIKKGG